jgi:alkylation response protein AidB-like acyl-CoA dehydrogenase
MTFKVPLRDIRFCLKEIAALEEVLAFPAFKEHCSADMIDAGLEENAKLVEKIVAPLNGLGDTQPPVWCNGTVATTAGFSDAFCQYVQGGWQGLAHPEKWGGQGLPKLMAAATCEALNAANLAFALCPLLTDGVIEALLTVGTDAQRARYVPAMINRRWTGTMNLTESQAGSDLAQITTRAVRQPDGTYRLTGEKIFITYGEHDMAENIVHLVLARVHDAPKGIKGLSLFIVPKRLVEADGNVGKRNDVWCASIEHKLGIHASPTAVLQYGSDKGEVGQGAVGELVGQENHGLAYMFIMMNAARFAVGQQGIAVSERATQAAYAYACGRVQGHAVEGSSQAVPIVQHPDVRRMLMTMTALTQANRAVAFLAAGAHDRANHHGNPEVCKQQRALYEFLVPVVKAGGTESSLEVCSLGVQVHGGMGFIEETGAAQYYRDARILTIYEGTTAIQANDFVARKTLKNGGAMARTQAEEMRKTLCKINEMMNGVDPADKPAWIIMAQHFNEAIYHFDQSIKQVLAFANVKVTVGQDGDAAAAAGTRAAYAASVPYLMLACVTFGGWMMVRSALACESQKNSGDSFLQQKLNTAMFYCAHILPRTGALAAAIRNAQVADQAGARVMAAEQ